MTYRIITGLIIALIVCSCTQQPSKSGLLIENKINRGTNYTDPRGTDHSIRYIPISITNDSTISIHVEITFSKEYAYPYPHSDEKFKLIPLPKEWALDGVGITDSMINALPKYIDTPSLKKTLEPGDTLVFAIGSLYPRPAQTSGVLPRTLFVESAATSFPECEWLMKDEQSSQAKTLGLKLVFGEYCRIIPVGQISYPKL